MHSGKETPLFHRTKLLIILLLLWQYVLWTYQEGGTKSEKKLAKNQQHTQRKLLNFENWVNCEVSKIGHHFRKQSDL